MSADKQQPERAWEIARALAKLIENQPVLMHNAAISYVIANGGSEFIYINRNNNKAIDWKVLYRFRKLTEKTIVWSWHGIFWRWRRPSDPPDRRRV
jgi:hypothetical protein